MYCKDSIDLKYFRLAITVCPLCRNLTALNKETRGVESSTMSRDIRQYYIRCYIHVSSMNIQFTVSHYPHL